MEGEMSHICKDCGTVGSTVTVTPGSIMIELLTWCCFLIPGLIYSFWRLSRRHQACRACRSVRLVPINSPVGRALVDRVGVSLVNGAPSPAESFGRQVGRLFAHKK
jgi:hypothetical protein